MLSIVLGAGVQWWTGQSGFLFWSWSVMPRFQDCVTGDAVHWEEMLDREAGVCKWGGWLSMGQCISVGVWHDIREDGQWPRRVVSVPGDRSFFSASFHVVLPLRTRVLHRNWIGFTFVIWNTTRWSRSCNLPLFYRWGDLWSGLRVQG